MTPASNKINWPKVARKALRISWWVIVFASKLVFLAGIAVFKLFEIGLSNKKRERVDINDPKNVNNYINPKSPLYEDDQDYSGK